MRKFLRNWFAKRVLSFVLWHMKKQRVYRLGVYGPEAFGRIIHGEIVKDPEGHPVDITLTWTTTGTGGATYIDFSFRLLKRVEELGWTFKAPDATPHQSS